MISENKGQFLNTLNIETIEFHLIEYLINLHLKSDIWIIQLI